MKIFLINDGRTFFWQWDTGQKLIVDEGACQEVHFHNGTTDCSLVCAVYEQDGKRFVNVPNILLQSADTLYAYAFLEDDDGERTKCSKCFKVYPRSKPADYVYTETEVWTAEKAVADALEEAKASGAFKGEKGDKGDKGDPGEPGGGQSYVLPIATPDTLGGVQPIAKTEDMTQSVGVDAEGGLWTAPGGGGGGETETLVASYVHNGNLEVTVSNIDYATSTITSTGHGLSENDMIYATLNRNCASVINPEIWLPSGMSYASRYYAINVTEDTFQISTSTDGTAVTLSTKTSADFTKWHFERDNDKYGSTISMKNLDVPTNFAVRILGKSLTVAPFYLGVFGVEGYTDSYADGFQGLNNKIGVLGTEYGDILLDVKVCVRYDEANRRYRLTREGLSVQNRKGSTYAVKTNNLECIVVSVETSPISIKTMVFWNCSPANGTIVEVYKL